MSSEEIHEGEPWEKILCLCGGGYLGLYSAQLLTYLEERLVANDPEVGQLHRVFRLIAGTSVGGLIGLAIAFKVPASKISSEIEKAGKQVFPPWWYSARWLRMSRLAIWGAMYNAESLIKVFSEIIGPEKTLADVSVPVCVTALDLTFGRPHVFVGSPGAEGADIKVVDVLRATTAAPLYFPAATIRDRDQVIMYADGGLFANAPDLVALRVAIERLSFQLSRIHLVSVGTTMIPPELPDLGTVRPWSSLIDWLKELRLIQHTMRAQMLTARQLAGAAMQDPKHQTRHRILDIDQPKAWQRFLRLDRADHEADMRIKWLAQRTIEQLELEQFRQDWII